MSGASGSTSTTGAQFSEALRSATWGDHRDAEGSGFLAALMGGELPPAAYADLVAQQWYAYVALEDAAAVQRHDPVAGVFVDDVLTRVPSIEVDLVALLGDGWAARVRALPATTAYCDRLREVGPTWPGGFVAHHYTRYLGDLSGGQHIGRAVDRIYGFEGGAGARFYAFDGISDPGAFKDAYRAALDAAPWNAPEQARIVEEVRRAYALNTGVLADLADAHLP